MHIKGLDYLGRVWTHSLLRKATANARIEKCLGKQVWSLGAGMEDKG